MIYTSPTLEFLGTIAGLTASEVKCTPGGDGGYTKYTPEGAGYLSVEDGGGGDPPSDFGARILNNEGCIHDTDPSWPGGPRV